MGFEALIEGLVVEQGEGDVVLGFVGDGYGCGGVVGEVEVPGWVVTVVAAFVGV